MPANSTHPDYDASLPSWVRARDVIAGEDAVKLGGIKYLPRLDSQTDDDYLGYKSRACFFNATSRTCDGFLGLLFRRDPEVKLPDRHAGVGGALRVFTDDVDLMGTSLFTFCKGIVGEVLAVGRCGTLIDWQADGESRAYVVRYSRRRPGDAGEIWRAASSEERCRETCARMTDQIQNLKKFRFVPEITLGNVLQLLTIAAAVVGLWVSLDKRLAAVEMQESYAIEERHDLKKSLATLAENQAVLARTVDRISILFEQHAKSETKGETK